MTCVAKGQSQSLVILGQYLSVTTHILTFYAKKILNKIYIINVKRGIRGENLKNKIL